jgi:DNA-binding NarL/FixJ family response regulator
MVERIGVYIYADDPILDAGVASQIRARAELQVVEPGDVDRAAVALVCVEEIDEDAATVIRAIQRDGCPRVIVVAARLDERSMLVATEAGACGLLRRADGNPNALATAIRAAVTGDGTLPADLLGRLLDQVGRLQRRVLTPQGLSFGGLTAREIDVLRLVADGHDTAQIAHELCYSERTIKNVIHDVTVRLQLRNRSHAVAYALKEGLI